eukprot:TRINITY_DN6588_c0_g2_i2.p1 TRINITY_DN6588_c0_g2~~TRINITY_DN6588_c0_g2_i2.p1  ORF type:complete len:397 (+),score=63.92 TRINITY_DN6588_c0_g2_i2:339-1529(+)
MHNRIKRGLSEREPNTPVADRGVKRVCSKREKLHWLQWRPRQLKEVTVKDKENNNVVMSLPSCYKDVEFLDSGTFGSVVSCIDGNGKKIVVKQIQCVDDVKLESGIRELHNLTFFTIHAPHKHIIKLLDCWYASDTLFLVLPRYAYSLQAHLEKLYNGTSKTCTTPKLSSKARKDISGYVLSAVRHLHSFGIVHRDLKPGNVVINEDYSDGCIIDLGSLRKPENAIERGPPLTPAKECMTEGYLPPETLVGKGAGYRIEADNFSVGLILYETITGRELIPEGKLHGEFKKLRLERNRRSLLAKALADQEGVTSDEMEIICSLLAAHPAARATSHQAYKMIVPNVEDDPPKPTVLYNEPVYSIDDCDEMKLIIKAMVSDFREWASHQVQIFDDRMSG